MNVVRSVAVTTTETQRAIEAVGESSQHGSLPG